ncbi:MAG: LVIVD repeat-containing protein [Acidimicrobiales bacterium]
MKRSSFPIVGVVATLVAVLGVGGGGVPAGALAPVGSPPGGSSPGAPVPAIVAPTPDLACTGPGDRPEAIQGRVPLADYNSGRAAQGYTCNASAVSHVGSAEGGPGASGGYRVFRYVDGTGRACAYYDTTLLFPANARAAGTSLTGVWVLDMTDPAHPVHTATLSTPAMQSPHESLSINVKRGLLGAVMGNPLFHPGQFDLYDLTGDCAHPVLEATLPMGLLGHEGSFAPDGLTYYAASLFGHTLTAIDVSNPRLPRTVWTSADWNVHGLNLSEDGNTLYFADLARNGADAVPIAGTQSKGLTVLDVSQIQARALNPQARVVSHLTWPLVSTPQTDLPITIGGHPYLVEIDEFASGNNVGAGRLIDIADVTHPFVASNLRLAVNNADHRTDGSQQNDPNATNGLQGYAGHYCAVPRKADPGIVACSFILSGLRVFDIRDPLNPVEIAYFNQPSTTTNAIQGPQGSYAMAQPAFDLARHQIWYSDGNSGFYDVQIADSVWPTPPGTGP